VRIRGVSTIETGVTDLRNTVHAIVAVLLWIVFVRYWQIVMQRPMSEDTQLALVTLGALAFLSALYLVVWVYYNVRLASRLQRRKARLMGVDTPMRDYMGRWIVVDDDAGLRRANYIEIEIKRIVRPDGTIEEKILRTSPEARDSDA
jgi:hypothetical protein